VIYVRAALNIPSLDSPLEAQGRLKVANHTLDEGEATATQRLTQLALASPRCRSWQYRPPKRA